MVSSSGVDDFDFVLETMEKLSGPLRQYVSVLFVAEFAALPQADVLQHMQTGAFSQRDQQESQV